jgi:hypothetical protein
VGILLVQMGRVGPGAVRVVTEMVVEAGSSRLRRHQGAKVQNLRYHHVQRIPIPLHLCRVKSCGVKRHGVIVARQPRQRLLPQMCRRMLGVTP